MTQPAPPEAPAAPGQQEETWAHAGVRVNAKGKRVHAWATKAGAGALLYYFTRSGPLVIGGLYQVKITCDNDRTIMHGEPSWTGRRLSNAGRITYWDAESRLATTKLTAAAEHRTAAAQDHLGEAMEPLLAIAGRIHRPADRDLFIATVTGRLYRAWR
jgi:hypothetical protein